MAGQFLGVAEAAQELLSADVGLAAIVNHVVGEKFGSHSRRRRSMGQAFREARPRNAKRRSTPGRCWAGPGSSATLPGWPAAPATSRRIRWCPGGTPGWRLDAAGRETAIRDGGHVSLMKWLAGPSDE